MFLLESSISNQLYIKIQTISSFSLNSLVVEHIKKLPISYIQKKDVAYLTQRVNSDCSNLISFGIGTIINVITPQTNSIKLAYNVIE